MSLVTCEFYLRGPFNVRVVFSVKFLSRADALLGDH